MAAIQDTNINARNIGDEYEIPTPEPSTSFSALKDRIKHHYEICSEYYYSLWGEHIHHGYFLDPTDTKEAAQARLIELLVERSELTARSHVLDVGCGIGGTSRYLARNRGCSVTGITISGQQVKMARNLTTKDSVCEAQNVDETQVLNLGDGRVRFIELDAEGMADFFSEEPNKTTFDFVWISEALSHLPDKELFFKSSTKLLEPGGKLVVADWFKAGGLTDSQLQADIKPIEDGMLLPGLCEQSEYVQLAKEAGLSVFSTPLDISKEVAKTWEISWSLIQSPALWAIAIAQGRDGLAFLQAFRAMRRGYTNGTFRYAVMVFQK